MLSSPRSNFGIRSRLNLTRGCSARRRAGQFVLTGLVDTIEQTFLPRTETTCVGTVPCETDTMLIHHAGQQMGTPPAIIVDRVRDLPHTHEVTCRIVSESRRRPGTRGYARHLLCS